MHSTTSSRPRVANNSSCQLRKGRPHTSIRALGVAWVSSPSLVARPPASTAITGDAFCMSMSDWCEDLSPLEVEAEAHFGHAGLRHHVAQAPPVFGVEH